MYQTRLFYSKDRFKKLEREREPHHKSPFTVTHKWNLRYVKTEERQEKEKKAHLLRKRPNP
jgi:hypothetical protein